MNKREGRPGIRTSPGLLSLGCYVNDDNDGAYGDDGSDGGDGNDDDEFSKSYDPYSRRDLERSSSVPCCLLVARFIPEICLTLFLKMAPRILKLFLAPPFPNFSQSSLLLYVYQHSSPSLKTNNK